MGTSIDFIAEVLSGTGDCHENLLPDTLPATIEEYTNSTDISLAMTEDAANFEVVDFIYQQNPSMEQIKQAIFQHKVVIAAVDCGDGWWTAADGTPSWLEKDVLPLRLGNLKDGHFILLYGYDQNYVYFRNSWSAKWGRNGDGYFDQSYIPHVHDIGTGVMKIVPPAPDTTQHQQRVISLYAEVVVLLERILALLETHKQQNV